MEEDLRTKTRGSEIYYTPLHHLYNVDFHQCTAVNKNVSLRRI